MIEILKLGKATKPCQQRGILGALDDKIEVNRRINRTLEEMAQTLYKHWFVDFGPFQAGEFVDSELGAVPVGWEVKPLSLLIEILSGGTPRTKIDEYWGGDIYWAAAGDVSAGAPFIMSTERTITPLGIENSSAKILPKFTTIITARGTVGECALTPFEMSMNQSNYGIRGAESLGDFTTYLLIKHTVQNLKKHAYGTVFDTITRKTFKAIPVVNPPVDVWERFENIVQPWFEQMLNNQQQNQILAETRDYLLPKVLSGEVEVPAAVVEGRVEGFNEPTYA